MRRSTPIHTEVQPRHADKTAEELSQTAKKLARAQEQLTRCRLILDELVVFWPEAHSVPLWWDRYRHVLVAPRHRTTYRGLFGSWAMFRGWQSVRFGAGKIRRLLARDRWVKVDMPGVPLPPDAVIAPLCRDGLVIVSAHAEIALKLVFGKEDGWKLQNEETALRMALRAGVEEYVPGLLESGRVHENAAWMCTRFVSNEQPIDQPLNPCADKYARWARWLRQDVLPVLEPFYEESGLEVTGGQEWLSSLADQIRRHPTPDPLWQIFQLADEARLKSGDDRVVRALTHGSLQPRHVHCNKGGWQMIDWGSSLRAPVSKDVFKMFFDPAAAPPLKRTFWLWLQGEVEEDALPPVVKAYLDLFKQWQRAWMGLQPDAHCVRMQLLGAMIGRFCTEWEVATLKPQLDGSCSLSKRLRALAFTS